MTKDRIIVTSGNYDFLTADDITFLQKCRSKGDWLIVGLHSDMAVHLQTNTLFNTYDDRQKILQGLWSVDEVLRFADNDGTCCNLLKLVKIIYPNTNITYVSKHDMLNMPETKIRGITFEVLN